jgi:hypothetical protein
MHVCSGGLQWAAGAWLFCLVLELTTVATTTIIITTTITTNSIVIIIIITTSTPHVPSHPPPLTTTTTSTTCTTHDRNFTLAISGGSLPKLLRKGIDAHKYNFDNVPRHIETMVRETMRCAFGWHGGGGGGVCV